LQKYIKRNRCYFESVAIHFEKSCKRKNELLRLQEEVAESTKCLKMYHKIRWLSWWQAVTILCDSLESVLIYFRDNQDMEDEVGYNIFKKTPNLQIRLSVLFFSGYFAYFINVITFVSK